MTLSEMLAEVGDDNLAFQNLDHDAVGCELHGGAGRFTFNTDPKYVHERATGEPEHVAFVVWMPRDKIPAGVAG